MKWVIALCWSIVHASSGAYGYMDNQDVLGSSINLDRYKAACPEYAHYAMNPQYVYENLPRTNQVHSLIASLADP